MSTGTSIQWTAATWNPVVGCTRVSAGCDSCYAVKQTYRLEKMGQAKYAGLTVLNGKGDRHFNGVVRTVEEALTIPLGWKKPRRIFVNSMSDLFHKDVPDDFIDRVFAVMALCPQHTFQVLTKRPERMAKYLARGFNDIIASVMASERLEPVGKPCGLTELVFFYERATTKEFTKRSFSDPKMQKPWQTPKWPPRWPFPNVWLGTSVENQPAADERIPNLLRCPAAVRFLSVEPLLDEVNLSLEPIRWIHPERGDDGRAAMGRIGVSVGEEFLMGSCAGWEMPVGIASRQKGDGLWARGHVVVHSATRHRLLGWHEPEYGDADRGMVKVEYGATNVVCGALRVSSIAGDPDLKFPIAKVPTRTVDWVIVGGESGPGARPCNIDWIRSIIRQCRAAGVRVFMKQVGSRPVVFDPGCGDEFCPDAPGYSQLGYRGKPLQDKKGGTMEEWPEDLRIREFPALAEARPA